MQLFTTGHIQNLLQVSQYLLVERGRQHPSVDLDCFLCCKTLVWGSGYGSTIKIRHPIGTMVFGIPAGVEDTMTGFVYIQTVCYLLLDAFYRV